MPQVKFEGDLGATLISRMEYLRELDQLRGSARSMRDEQLKTILTKSAVVDEADEGEEPSPTSAVLFRRAKQLGWYLGLHAHCQDIDKEPDHFLSWPKTTFRRNTRSTAINLLSEKRGDVQVFFATQFLRARLGNLAHGHLTADCARCYYRIIREIYTVRRNKPSLGAASADGGRLGPPTAFATAECARAIRQVIAGMQATSTLVQGVLSLHEERQRALTVLRVGPSKVYKAGEWHVTSGILKEVEKRYLLSLQCLIENKVDTTFLQVDVSTCESFEEFLTAIARAIVVFAVRSEVELASVLKELRDVGKDKDLKGFRRDGHDVGFAAINEAHAALKRMSSGLKECLPLIFEQVRGPSGRRTGTLRPAKKGGVDTEIQRGYAEAVAAVDKIARGLSHRVRLHLDFAQSALEAWMYKSAFLVAINKEMDALEDLVFSADAFGSLTQRWDHPGLREAIVIIVKNLDRNGRIPRGRPFSERPGGGRRHVETPHTIRAIAHLLQHVPFDLDVDVARRLVGYFESQLAPTDYEKMRQWPRRVPVWYRAISCIALHRVVLMLSSVLNREIKRHFTVDGPAHLAKKGVPALGKLMWTDLGVTGVLADARASLSSIHDHLCGMRNALSGSRAETRTLPRTHSLLLYGPPGTGKSTLLESLAVTSGADLVVVSPDNFFFEGLESLERQCAAVMDALGMLTESIVLFDEFEQMIQARDQDKKGAKSQMDHLTANMLPKISRLNARAKENRIVYSAATNFVDQMDEAAIRDQRFDVKACVFFPDPCARFLQASRTVDRCLGRPSKSRMARVARAIADANFASAARLANVGWFGGSDWDESDLGLYVLGNGGAPRWPVPKPEHVSVQADDSLDGQFPDPLTHERDLVVGIVKFLESAAFSLLQRKPKSVSLTDLSDALENREGICAWVSDRQTRYETREAKEMDKVVHFQSETP